MGVDVGYRFIEQRDGQGRGLVPAVDRLAAQADDAWSLDRDHLVVLILMRDDLAKRLPQRLHDQSQWIWAVVEALKPLAEDATIGQTA